jgi:hypothetical protein
VGKVAQSYPSWRTSHARPLFMVGGVQSTKPLTSKGRSWSETGGISIVGSAFARESRSVSSKIASLGFLSSNSQAALLLHVSPLCLSRLLQMAERCSSSLEGTARSDPEHVFFTFVPRNAADNTTNAVSIITHPTTPTTKITGLDSAERNSAEGFGGYGNLRLCFSASVRTSFVFLSVGILYYR